MRAQIRRPFVRVLKASALTLALAALIVAGGVSRSEASAGDLDQTFDGDGRVLTDLGTFLDQANALAVQADGKIVAAGATNGLSTMFTLVRYDTDGSLDETFGNGGVVVTETSTATSAIAHAVAIQADGKIVAAGEKIVSGTQYDFMLTRYETDGTLDETFGDDGVVLAAMSTDNDYAYSVAVRSDGRIVAAGTVWSSASYNSDFGVARFNADGSLDDTFDSDGKVLTDFGSLDEAFSVAVQADGKILAAGSAYIDGTAVHDFAMARYDEDGSLDAAFDGDGLVTTPIGATNDHGADVAVQDDGKIVIAGQSEMGANNWDFTLARYDADGSLDTTFDGDGKVSTDFGMTEDRAEAVAILANGTIVAAGQTGAPSPKFALAKYDATGAPDPGFGDDGRVVTDFVFGTADNLRDAALSPDGRIVVAGVTQAPLKQNIAVARYWGANLCAEPELVETTPCLEGGKARLRIAADDDPKRNQISWKLGKGDAFDHIDLGTPDSSTAYQLCIYDSTAGSYSLAGALDLAVASTWQPKGTNGWQYRDGSGATDGVSQLKLKPGAAGTTKVQLLARGVHVPMPAPVSGSVYFDQDPSVIVMLATSDGVCWSSTLGTSVTTKNDGTEFSAKAP